MVGSLRVPVPAPGCGSSAITAHAEEVMDLVDALALTGKVKPGQGVRHKWLRVANMSLAALISHELSSNKPLPK